MYETGDLIDFCLLLIAKAKRHLLVKQDRNGFARLFTSYLLFDERKVRIAVM